MAPPPQMMPPQMRPPMVPPPGPPMAPPGPQAMPPPQMPPPPMAPPPPMFHDVKIKRTRKTERAVVMPVPPEEFGISRYARSLHDCGYCYHDVIRREAELIHEGYDPKQLEKLTAYTGLTNQEEMARDSVDERESGIGDSGLNTANREIRITEHYIVMDYKDDGKPCMYKIVTGGEPTEILSKEGEDDVAKWDGPPPFAAGCPFPIPHRFFGRSVADLIMDLQRIKTAVLRGGLNNIYLQTNPRIEVAESHASINTMDDLLTSRPNGVIRTKIPGGLNWQKVPDVTSSLLPTLQYLDSQREQRSGVSRQGQGVNPDALQNQVATIANQMEDASQAKMKQIARNLAEGLRDAFALLHATIRRHGSIKQTVRLRGKWVTVDPRSWKARSDMTVNVGLGTGNKASLLAQLNMVIQSQKDGVAIGLVSKRNFHNSARDLIRLVKPGGDVNAYFCDPSAPPDPNDPASAPLPPPMNPKQMEIQGKQQIEQGRQQGVMQIEAAKNETQRVQIGLKAQLEAVQARADAAVLQAKAQSEAALNQREAQFKAALAERDTRQKAALAEQRHAFDMQLAIAGHDMKAREHFMNMTQKDQAHKQKMMQTAAAQSEGNSSQMAELIRAMNAPRTRKVIRNPKTNMVEGVVETIDHKK